MCRIAAIVGKDYKGAAEAVVRMTDAMAHGGPDDVGLFVDEINGVVLGHRRLSIIDLSEAGHQPMADISGQYTISFNGEIYNYEEIRNELIQLGYSFRSHSDTEVLIYGYQHWGTDLLPRLKGMFAFILLDKIKGQLIAARDHAGIKPLYYGHRNGSLYFSSEVRAILAADPQWPQDEHWQVRFLAFGFIPEPFSTLQNLFHLPKASYLTYDFATTSLSIHNYIQFPFTSTITSEEVAVNQTRIALLKAVERHLVADVPVGVFLSGGIDSSILTFACRKFNKGQLKTLSIYFEDEKYSEKYYQDLVVEKTGVEHVSFLVTQQDFEEALPEIFRAMDQPSIDGINSFFITRYAKQYGLKVVLSGLGADELFGGYGSFYNSNYQLVKKWRLLTKIVAAFMISYPAKKLCYINNGSSIEEYLFNRGLFVPTDIARVFGLSVKKVWQILGESQADTSAVLNHGNRNSLQEQSIYMQNQLLRDSDIYSMWHSIELRVPFLDVDVIKLAHSIAPHVKFKQAQKKHLLIKAFKDELPEAIWNRQKMGFTFPFQNWFKDSHYLRTVEQNDQKLKPVRQSFDKGTLNWSRYWAQVVASERKKAVSQ